MVIPVHLGSSVCLENKLYRVSQGEQNILPQLNQRSRILTLNLGQRNQATGRVSDFRKSPRLCYLPLQGWVVLRSLSYHAKEESYFYFAKRGFSMKWMLNVIKCLFIIPGFSLLAY